jgi:hypothetical protein
MKLVRKAAKRIHPLTSVLLIRYSKKPVQFRMLLLISSLLNLIMLLAVLFNNTPDVDNDTNYIILFAFVCVVITIILGYGLGVFSLYC